MKPYILTLAAASILAMSATAQEQEEPKFTIKPTGRILMDGAVYLGGNDNYSEESGDKKFVSGVAIPDLRIGVKAGYGKWKAKIDVGFGYGKVSLKDVYVEYDFNENHLIKGGYFVPQFGLNSETSSSMKPDYEEPSSNEFFNANPRYLALSYVFDKGQYFAAVSAFAEANAMKQNATEMGKQGWGAETRLVWRPRHSDGNTIQVGCSFAYTTPTDDDHTAFNYSSNFPSRVSKVNLLSAYVDNARGSFRMTPELLLIHNNFALEAQYYYMNIARKGGLHNYRAQGAYGLFRTLLIGDNYGYSHGDCGMATPAAKSLELVLGYNYTNASDSRAGIFGGISNDASCTINYYINKYMIARLRYSYTNVRDRVVEGLLPSRHVNTIEARFQIIF